MALVARTAAAVLALALAGCIGGGEPAAATSTELPTSSGASTSTPTPSPPGEAILNRLFLTAGCHGPLAGAFLVNGAGPPPPRPEWAPQGLGEVKVLLQFLECERLAFLDFERGPIRMAIESHGFASPPSDACFGDKAGEIMVLHRIYVDDREMAAALAAAFGAPSDFAQFGVDVQSDIGSQVWSMTVEGYETTEVRFAELVTDEADLKLTVRYAYPWSQGIAFLELTTTEHDSNTNPPAAVGTMAPPTVYGEYVGPAFLGVGEVYSELEADGEFVFFDDVYCKVPV